ncbi:hypothetical protein [Paraburkholderia sp. SIMBA_054]|uniref:hypothetical protein n=1 Tax=Paraburkholderia sp. SIMBA_054 TaxID=3085795 RepID=UPI00397A8121
MKPHDLQATADNASMNARGPSPYTHDPIFYVTVSLLEAVHAGAVGFTRTVDKLVCARDAEEAERVATSYFASRQCKVDKASARPSVRQDVRTFIAHQIVNLPAGIVSAEFDRQGTPAEYRHEPVYIDPSARPAK